MIAVESKLVVADNSGAKVVRCVGLRGPTGKRCACIGETVLVSVQEAIPGAKIKKGGLYAAVIVRTKKWANRKNNMLVRFSDNAVVLLGRQSLELIGTRVIGPVAREVRASSPRIASLASEVC